MVKIEAANLERYQAVIHLLSFLCHFNEVLDKHDVCSLSPKQMMVHILTIKGSQSDDESVGLLRCHSGATAAIMEVWDDCSAIPGLLWL